MNVEENVYIFRDKTKKVKVKRGELNMGQELTDSERDQLVNILNKFDHMMSLNEKLENCSVIECEIDTKDHKPFHATPYRQSIKIKVSIRKQIDDWLRDGFIHMSKSPWASSTNPLKVLETLKKCRGESEVTKTQLYSLFTRKCKN